MFKNTMKDYRLSTDRAAADIARRSQLKQEFKNATVRVDEQAQKVIIELDLSVLGKEELQKSNNGKWRILADSRGSYRLRIDGLQHVAVKFAAFIAEEEYQPPNITVYKEAVRNDFNDPKALAAAVMQNQEAMQILATMLQQLQATATAPVATTQPQAQVSATTQAPKRRGRPPKNKTE